MSFEIKPAARSAVKPLVGFYGKSGSGKTMSALLFARGIAGPKGRIVLIDTENRRGSYYADIVPGGYSVLDLDEPFSPQRYKDAIEEAEKHADVIVIDSMSHEWASEGGVLEMQEAELDRMAGNDWKKRDQCNPSAWNRAKMPHKKMVGRLLRSKLPIICCLRGEDKLRIEKKDGKTVVSVDKDASPIADPRFIFEMTVNFETIAINGEGGYVKVRKGGHPSLRPLLPKDTERVSERHGAIVANWCASPSVNPTATGAPSASAPASRSACGLDDESDVLRRELRSLTPHIHGWKPGMTPGVWEVCKPKLEQRLWDEAIISDTESLDSLSIDRLREVVAKVKEGQNA